MSGRDHSIECERCGMWYGGIGGPDHCECPPEASAEDFLARMDTLAHNIKIGAALCHAWRSGFVAGSYPPSGDW